MTILQKRPEMNMQYLIEDYKFSAVQRPMFSSDGEIMSCKDKSAVLHLIKYTESPTNCVQSNSYNSKKRNFGILKVGVFDRTAVVNTVTKTQEIKICRDFAEVFVEKFLKNHRNLTKFAWSLIATLRTT